MAKETKTRALILATGVVAGTGIGYLFGSGMGGGLPQIKIFNAAGQQTGTIPSGASYSLYFVGFPPNTQLVSARNASVAGGDLVNLGVTGADGVLTISGLTATGAGTYYISGFDAPTGKYCAVATLIVT